LDVRGRGLWLFNRGDSLSCLTKDNIFVLFIMNAIIYSLFICYSPVKASFYSEGVIRSIGLLLSMRSRPKFTTSCKSNLVVSFESKLNSFTTTLELFKPPFVFTMASTLTQRGLRQLKINRPCYSMSSSSKSSSYQNQANHILRKPKPKLNS
jgi:hypothetical protein